MIIAGNFKMNKTRRETETFLTELEKKIPAGVEVVIFPPMTALLSHRLIGAQNGYPKEKGAVTGEVGLEQLREFKIDKILIGHSERRKLGEGKDFLAQKFQFFKKHNFQIFFCIGEPLEVRQKGKKEVFRFLKGQLEGIDLGYSRLVVAYEPVWAIGSGMTPTPAEIEEVHRFIKNVGAERVIYGGSVSPKNAQSILEVEEVDGVLVGGASLKLETFLPIVEIGATIVHNFSSKLE